MERNYYRIKATLEFDNDLKRYIKRFGKSSTGNIERTFSVIGSMPLISLHYALTKAFGFLNEHLHRFKLDDEEFELVTMKDTETWRSYVGELFKSPYRDENEDFWCDDYNKGSFNNWRKKKYRYPYPIYTGLYDGYEQWQDALNSLIESDNDEYVVYNNKADFTCVYPYDLAVERGLNVTRKDVVSFNDVPLNQLRLFFESSMNDLLDTLTVEEIYQRFKNIIYLYDYGDNWTIDIEIELETDVDIIEQIEDTKLPVMVSYEGYNMVEDVGGTSGYVLFLLTLFNLKEINAEDTDGESILEADSKFYKWIDEGYTWNYIDLSPNRMLGWALGLEWDYTLPDVKNWFK